MPKIVNKKIDKIFDQGLIEGEFIIPFDQNGNIGDDYGFSGKIVDASINITKDLRLKNFTSKINHSKDKRANLFDIMILKGSLLDFDLTNSVFNIKLDYLFFTLSAVFIHFYNARICFLNYFFVNSIY